ncbi:hypothetical protein ATE84_0623 [Aquimarina sp. MAR_2010_214]|nr:hypothetical protein ATE84_0623 [Aquimarina sp. MAR_2010_214]
MSYKIEDIIPFSGIRTFKNKGYALFLKREGVVPVYFLKAS